MLRSNIQSGDRDLNWRVLEVPVLQLQRLVGLGENERDAYGRNVDHTATKHT
jgi:hypothetical protein